MKATQRHTSVLASEKCWLRRLDCVLAGAKGVADGTGAATVGVRDEIIDGREQFGWDANGDAFGGLAVQVATVEAVDGGAVLEPVVAEVHHRLTDPRSDGPVVGGELFVAVLRDAEREPVVDGGPVMVVFEGTGHTLEVSGLGRPSG